MALSRSSGRSIADAAGIGPDGRLRVGVFGGAFDPPHNTHVALAAAAMAQSNLAELRIFPTGQAWHKTHAPTGAGHRLAMAELAFGGMPGVIVDSREIRRAGPTFTLDTLRELLAERPDIQPVLIMGSDQAAALPRWHGWKDILAIAIVSIAERLESALPDDATAAADAFDAADANGASGPAARFDPRNLPGLPAGARFETLELPPVDTSATDIRARAARGQDIAALVPPAVARYIDQHHLYAPA